MDIALWGLLLVAAILCAFVSVALKVHSPPKGYARTSRLRSMHSLDLPMIRVQAAQDLSRAD
jgi:hypothetical protein